MLIAQVIFLTGATRLAARYDDRSPEAAAIRVRLAATPYR